VIISYYRPSNILLLFTNFSCWHGFHPMSKNFLLLQISTNIAITKIEFFNPVFFNFAYSIFTTCGCVCVHSRVLRINAVSAAALFSLAQLGSPIGTRSNQQLMPLRSFRTLCIFNNWQSAWF